MFDQLLDSFKGQIAQTLQGDSATDGLNHDEIAGAAGTHIAEKLQQMIASGDYSAVQEMFSGSETTPESMAASPLQSGLVESLMQKFGIDASQASGMVSKILPSIMNMFNNKVNDAKSSGGFDIGNLISQFTGGDNNSSGISDIISQFTGNHTSGGGGLLDSIKGFFK